jgi:uncharacterized protein YmfQ (DUF2313 family)
MGLSVDDYASLLKALLPQGVAWAKDNASRLNDLVFGLAEEFARLDSRANTLLTELDPRETTELLYDWERVLGLPDNCSGIVPDTLTERRNAIVTKLNAIGGQSSQYFIDLAAAAGFQITVTEFRPFVTGSDAGTPLYGEAWAYAWQVNSALNTITEFVAGSGAGEPLRDWGNALLECLINRYKPAHTTVLFAYT